MAPPMYQLRVHPTPADGSCMFHAVVDCLKRYNGIKAPDFAARLRDLGLPEVQDLSAGQLRLLVYSVFLVPGEDTDSWLASWQMMFAVDPAEYGHAAVLSGKTIPADLTSADRAALVSSCLRPTTWGDETALVILELLLGLRIMVITNNRMQTRPNAYGDFVPELYILLRLSHHHYESVSWTDGTTGRSLWAFAEAELPNVYVQLAHRDCAAASEPFVNLAHLMPGPHGVAVPARHRPDPPVAPSLNPLAAKLRMQYLRVAASGVLRSSSARVSAAAAPVPVPLPSLPSRTEPTFLLDGGPAPRPRWADEGVVAPVTRLQCGIPLPCKRTVHTENYLRHTPTRPPALFGRHRLRPYVMWGGGHF